MFEFFYHATLERLVKAFGSLFNDISIVRYDKNMVEVDRIKVPINYANRHTYIARLESQPQLEDYTHVENIFPRMSFELGPMTYSGSRHLNLIHRQRSEQGEDGSRKMAYQCVEYDVSINLTIVSKHIRDSNEILEQILPYFAPDCVVQVHAIPELGYIEKMPITLESVNASDNYAEELESGQRIVKYELGFSAMVRFHGPVQTNKIIKNVQTDFGTPKDFTEETIEHTPRIARDTVGLDPVDANPQDVFGYTETWQEFSDGKKYNPLTDSDEDIPPD